MKRWKQVAQHAAENRVDPWADRHIERLPTEVVTRHRYKAETNSWMEDEVMVKIESEPFAHGAQRNCFRMKKMSTLMSAAHRGMWELAENYVAKSYINAVERDVYFHDIKLQMDSKLWAERFNRYSPPKKVDMMRAYLIERPAQNGKPAQVFAVEHLLEGNYIKFNSNKGYVEGQAGPGADEHTRLTPQAFSHFTYEESHGELIVVDIQGVQNMWTDPQIHTRADDGLYGEGNLGEHGIAYFFATHVCNALCEHLGLSPIQTAPNQKERVKKSMVGGMSSAGTAWRSQRRKSDVQALKKRMRGARESSLVAEAMRSVSESSDAEAMIKEVREAVGGSLLAPQQERKGKEQEQEKKEEHSSREEELLKGELEYVRGMMAMMQKREEWLIAQLNVLHPVDQGTAVQKTGKGEIKGPDEATEEAEEEGTTEEEEEAKADDELNARRADLHVELARMHCRGTFSEDEPDTDSALFHIKRAADSGKHAGASAVLWHLYSGRGTGNTSILPEDLTYPVTVDPTLAQVYLRRAAQGGDRAAQLEWVEQLEREWADATDEAKKKETSERIVSLLSEAAETPVNEEALDTPRHAVLAHLARVYLDFAKDGQCAGDTYTSAGDEAMATGKGKMATKYYALAEEAWATIE